MSRENVEVVRAVYDEWAKGNFRAGVELYDPNILLVLTEDFPEADKYLGIEGVGDYMRGFLSAWDELSITAEEFIAAGDSVVVAVQQHGAGRGSGISGDHRYFHVWTFRGGAVTRLDVIGDRARALEAVGLRE